MTGETNTNLVPGWVGGFEESNSQFAYPDPNLTALPMLDNMANIDKLQRQQAVKWPEFSWETQKGQPDPKRCFQRFSHNISRLGYTDKGRVFSIICPQQGTYSPSFGALNVEVTVTGQRGWVNESTKQLAADMEVVGKIWFSPSAHQKEYVKLLWNFFKKSNLPFPFDKANAIRVTTHKPGNPKQPVFPLRLGETTDFKIPNFAKHKDEAWDVANLGVEIGPITKVGHSLVDEFNELVMDVFNMGSGNMLQEGNILTWDVWFTPPQLVNVKEWRDHAEYWRDSIDSDHGSPGGKSSKARYFDGAEFKPLDNMLDVEREKIEAFIKKHLL